MSIKNVSSSPEYINTFIQHNMNKLMEIYEEGYENNNNEGCLYFICNEITNKMDVSFVNNDTISNIMMADTWENVKSSIHNNKKLFLVKDEVLNSIFLIYI